MVDHACLYGQVIRRPSALQVHGYRRACLIAREERFTLKSLSHQFSDKADYTHVRYSYWWHTMDVVTAIVTPGIEGPSRWISNTQSVGIAFPCSHWPRMDKERRSIRLFTEHISFVTD